jgi:hypothetical protein
MAASPDSNNGRKSIRADKVFQERFLFLVAQLVQRFQGGGKIVVPDPATIARLDESKQVLPLTRGIQLGHRANYQIHNNRFTPAIHDVTFRLKRV